LHFFFLMSLGFSTPEPQLPQHSAQHEAYVELMEMRSAAARDEIRRRKDNIAEIQRQLLDIEHDCGHDDVTKEVSPTKVRAVSARLYPGPARQRSMDTSSTSHYPPLSAGQVAALGQRLSPTPSPVVSDLPPMIRRVVTSADFRKGSKTRAAVKNPAQFTEQTALRLASQDPTRRAETRKRMIAMLEQEMRKGFTTHATPSELQKAIERNYEAAAMYAKKHEHAVDVQLKRADNTVHRTCARKFDASVFDRLRFESAEARKKREQLERDYADNFAPSGTAYLRKTKGDAGVLPSTLHVRLFSELTKGHGFEWRRSPAPSS
jgi:hypothetical protein